MKLHLNCGGAITAPPVSISEVGCMSDFQFIRITLGAMRLLQRFVAQVSTGISLKLAGLRGVLHSNLRVKKLTKDRQDQNMCPRETGLQNLGQI